MSKIYVATLPVTVKRECNRLSQVTPKSRPSNSLSSVALRLNERTRSPRRRSLCVCAQECVCVCMYARVSVVCCPLQAKLFLHAVFFSLHCILGARLLSTCCSHLQYVCVLCCGLCLGYGMSANSFQLAFCISIEHLIECLRRVFELEIFIID